MRDFKKSNSFGKRKFGPRPSFGAKRDFDRPTERHQAECNKCHKMCEVPFRPNGKKPVYCRECFRSEESSSSYGRGTDSPRESSSASDLKKEFSLLNTKLDKLIALLEAKAL